MQNRNNTIEERLQILNDYIQRTMDALNATRQVIQGLNTQTNYTQGFVNPNVSGINHSTFVPQVVQTPYGFVAVAPQVTQLPQIPNITQIPQQLAPLGYGFGLQHTSFIPQLQGWPVNMAPLGVPQVGLNYNFGVPNGLNHASFVPQVAGVWGTLPMTIAPQWPMQNLGVNQVVPQNVVPQNVVPTQTF